MAALEVEQEVVVAGLLLAKRAVDCGLKITKRFFNR